MLGFEAAGVVDAVGSAVTDVSTGDEVAVFLPGLGGYAELVLADYWVRKPPLRRTTMRLPRAKNSTRRSKPSR